MNTIERFRKFRKYQIGGTILKFADGNKALSSKKTTMRDSNKLFERLFNINPKVHNKNTFAKIYNNIESVYDGLVQHGLSQEEIAGIMGNMLAENVNFDPNVKNGQYMGLVQVNPAIQEYITTNYGDFSDITNQLKFIADWTKGVVYSKDPYNTGYGYKRYSGAKANSPETYAKAWSDHFERHGGGSTLRQKYAKMFYDYFNEPTDNVAFHLQ